MFKELFKKLGIELTEEQANGISDAFNAEITKQVDPLKAQITGKDQEITKIIANRDQILAEKQRKRYENLSSMVSESRTRIQILEKEKIKRLEEDINNRLDIKKKLDEIKKKYGKPSEALKKKKTRIWHYRLALFSYTFLTFRIVIEC